MNKQGLIIGIDYTNEYCQACYYNHRHHQPESVTTGSAVMRYLVPTVLCYSSEKGDWLIGDEAAMTAEQTGCYLFRDLLNNTLDGEKVIINDASYTYDQLLAVYFGKLLQLIQIQSGYFGIESITVNLRRVNLDVKQAMERVFDILAVDPARVRILSCAESFAYYVLNEDPQLWGDGALLFDFGNYGFFAKQLTLAGTREEPLFYVNERNYSIDFSMKDLASELARIELDGKLSDIYEDIKFEGKHSSVYFTGEGFSELWFRNTLKTISQTHRAFKGNNLYVKGACLAGYIRADREGKDYPIICRGRTKASISVLSREKGSVKEVEISGAAIDWYDAAGEAEFILVGDKSADVVVTSLVSRERTKVTFDLSSFPDRPYKTTRVQVSARYLNDAECDVTVRDMGFGSLYESSGMEVTKRLNLEGYI